MKERRGGEGRDFLTIRISGENTYEKSRVLEGREDRLGRAFRLDLRPLLEKNKRGKE